MATKRLLMVAAILMLANLVETRQGLPLLAQDQVGAVIEQVRTALGGDRLAAVKTLSAEGPFRRSMGQRDMEGTIVLTLQRPDRIRRAEEMGMGGMVGGPTVERISGFDGTVAWDDIQNRGGMGGGMRMMIRGPGDGPGGGPGGGMLTPEQIEQQRVRRMRNELQRWTVALFADSARPFNYAGVAESPDGKADILETTDEADRPVRLFVSQASHLPLMVQYMEVRPRVMVQGGPGGPGGPGRRGGGPPPSREEMEQRIEEMRKQGPPPPSAFSMHLGEYRTVDGVQLPHRVTLSVEGQPTEEWTIEKYRVNPNVKASEFEKPKS